MKWKRTPQGYVITTATITRAGPIEYYGHELGLTGSDANKKITVIRTLDELSKPETLASFNGLPFTITHPDDGEVTAADHKDKASGHIANTRIEGGEVVCDVYLTDAAAIETLEETGITGKNVQLITDTSNKTIADMSSDEFVKLVLDAYNVAWRKSSYRIQPTNIAMDASDFMLAMQKFDPNPIIVGTDMLPIAAMDRIMAALRKASGNESFNISFVKVPSNYAVGIKAGKTRMAVYTYESDYVEMEVHMPELLAVRQRDLLTYECGYRSAFGGAMWKQPQSAVYVDYKSSPAPQ